MNTTATTARQVPQIVDRTPAGQQARILAKAIGATRPASMVLPQIAHDENLTLAAVQSLLNHHGYPDKARMTRAAHALQAYAENPPAPVPLADTDTTDTTGPVIRRVKVTDLHPDPDNLRTDAAADIDDLAASISQVGLLQPIVVRRAGDRLIIVAGHRRAAALRRLGWTETEVLLNPIAEADVLVAMLIENTQRSDLDPIEEARAYALLKERDHLGDLQLAGRVGKSQSHVSARLALLELPEADQAAIRAGTLTLGEGTKRGRKLAGTHRPGALGKASAAHLSEHHPLAPAVEALCRHQGHSKMTAGRVGGVGCGRCWEDVIRSDERTQAERSRRRTDAEAS